MCTIGICDFFLGKYILFFVISIISINYFYIIGTLMFQDLYITISLPCRIRHIQQILNSTLNEIESHNLFML